MINILVNGCNGRMGRAVIASAREAADIAVVGGIDPKRAGEEVDGVPVFGALGDVKVKADAVIDFSVPEATKSLVEAAVDLSVPLVIATSGLTDDDFAAIRDASERIPIVRAPNMSIGITLLGVLLRQATAVLGEGYDVEIVERYHRGKKDAPSGTSNNLANMIASASGQEKTFTYGRHNTTAARESSEIGIHSVRAGTIVGEHEVLFAGTDEIFSLSHRAFSRSLFAAGALSAARFLRDKKEGLYTMENVIEPLLGRI